MLDNSPSATAWRVALLRAAHQYLDAPCLTDDPIAARLAGSKSAFEDENQLKYWNSAPAKHLRAIVAARGRYAEDRLNSAVPRGVSQFVILGAGFETFAYRNPFPQGTIRVFEVDHPATQGKKRDMLEQAGIPLPVDLVFAPIDFEKSTVNEALREAGMDFSKPAFFSWLGVTMYLTRDALEGTFRMVGSMPAQSEIVFDYMIDPSLAPPAAHPVIEAIMRRAEDAGEPWRSFFHPQTLRADLTGWGFTTFEDLGREEINTRYFSGRTDDLRGGGLARFMSAVV